MNTVVILESTYLHVFTHTYALFFPFPFIFFSFPFLPAHQGPPQKHRRAAKQVRRAEHGLEAGTQGAVTAAESSLPSVNGEQDLRRGEHDLVEGFHKAENAFSRTGLGPEIRKGEHDLIGEVRKLDHEFPHRRLEQEIRKEGAKLVEDNRKVENDPANTGFRQEVEKSEHHLMKKFQRLEHDLSDRRLSKDFRRGEQYLKQGLQEAAAHLYKDKQALGRGAEAAGRFAKDRLEQVRRLAVEGTAIGRGLGMVALDHAGSGNNASGLRTGVRQPGHHMVKPISQPTPIVTDQPAAGSPHPAKAPGLHPVTQGRRSSQPPTNDQNRPRTEGLPRHPQAPQASQPGDSHGPPTIQQPHLSPIPFQARNPFPGPATNKSPQGIMPSSSPENNQRSQATLRKPVLPPRTQGSPRQKPPTTMPRSLRNTLQILCFNTLKLHLHKKVPSKISFQTQCPSTFELHTKRQAHSKASPQAQFLNGFNILSYREAHSKCSRQVSSLDSINLLTHRKFCSKDSFQLPNLNNPKLPNHKKRCSRYPKPACTLIRNLHILSHLLSRDLKVICLPIHKVHTHG